MCIIWLSSLSLSSQNLTLINLEEIPQRKIRSFIKTEEINKMNDFSKIRPSCPDDARESDYNVMVKTFFLNNRISDVWDCYRHADIPHYCNNHSVRFGLLLKKGSNSVVYTGSSELTVIDTGQVYFLNLRLLKGLLNLPVAFEIINIDPRKMVVELSYIEGNKTKGKQSLQFFEESDEITRIVHRSYFKSDSSLRDAVFYPLFHKKFIKEFHKIMKLSITNSHLLVFNRMIKQDKPDS
ncbi:MAG: hypothetical protein HZB98_08515 [Bacteroidia bacterium]|nr:hypothetical protein [Bacteroidia bacterium]